MSTWIYIFGERAGRDLKIGHTRADEAAKRLHGVNGEQTTDENYVCLAAVLGSTKDEKVLHREFGHLLRSDKGAKREYFWAAPELVEYAAWLRGQWFASPDGTDSKKGYPRAEPELWLPDIGRRIPEPEPDLDKLVQDWETLPGPLAGTPWDWMPNPEASFQDYFTPPDIVQAARKGMGDIDLDAAGHPAANRKHRIPKYFHVTYSAFENPWHGRVWLNPPYGENDLWWPRVVEQVRLGNIEQICILSPVWAFTTQLARPLIKASSAFLLFEPTPKFWGNKEGRTGTNNPHAILYIGNRPKEVLRALRPFGIPLHLDLELLEEIPAPSTPESLIGQTGTDDATARIPTTGGAGASQRSDSG